MRRVMKGCLLAACLGSGVAAQAKDCWNEQAIAAAHVRNLQSLLMSSALQCRLIPEKVDVIADYNRFIQGRRGELETINRHLKVHFARHAGSEAAGQVDYDRFTTALANAATRGRVITPVECRKMAALARVATQSSASVLVELALSQGSDPSLPSDICVVEQIAAAPTEVESFAPVGEFGPIERVGPAQGIPQPTYTTGRAPEAGFTRLGAGGPPQP